MKLRDLDVLPILSEYAAKITRFLALILSSLRALKFSFLL